MILYINVTEMADKNGLVNYLYLVISYDTDFYVFRDTLTYNGITFAVMPGFIFSTYQSRMNLLLKIEYTPSKVVRLVNIFNCFAYDWTVRIPDTTLLSFPLH